MQKAIVQNGKVINVLTYTEDIGIQGIRLRRDQMLIDASGFDVRIGDDYDDAGFTRGGAPCAYLGENAPDAGEMLDALVELGVDIDA